MKKTVQTFQSKIVQKAWKYYIEFVNDTFGPYDYIFTWEDRYFDNLDNRIKILNFPYKNKQFQNSEIFLWVDYIAIATWKRIDLNWNEKDFLDIINLIL